MFKPVSGKLDVPALEREQIEAWRERDTMARYLARNERLGAALQLPGRPDHRQQPDGRPPRLGPHLQGPVPALPHHARRASSATRTASTARGSGSRSRSRRSSASTPSGTSRRSASTEFVEQCKERVHALRRRPDGAVDAPRLLDGLGQLATTRTVDENNYTIWHFLKDCHERGWIYKGHDVMPWCPRCGTGISEQEIVTEGYHETAPDATVRLPQVPAARRPSESLLVWTTTPWTLAGNVAAAVHPELTYVQVEAATAGALLSRRARQPRADAASTRCSAR